jgi:MoxR-like ATPase
MESRLAACLFRNTAQRSSDGARVHRLVYGRQRDDGAEKHMSLADAERNNGAVEQCLDELNHFIDGLQRYPPTILAVALRVHLETLLQALLEAKICSREEVRDFVRELERDALQYDAD